MQFVYQSGDPPGICIWYVDVTVAHNTKNKAGYLAKCLPIQQGNITPFLGPGGVIEFFATVIAFDSCSSAGSNCQIAIVAYDNQQPGDWYALTSPIGDALGLSGNWFDTSGTILGRGRGSTAVFTGPIVLTALNAYTCIRHGSSPDTVAGVAETSLTGPTPCHENPDQPLVDFLSSFNGVATVTGVTAETNNMTNGPVNFSCVPFYCTLAYRSSAPGRR
jgi:hypothetical protein